MRPEQLVAAHLWEETSPETWLWLAQSKMPLQCVVLNSTPRFAVTCDKFVILPSLRQDVCHVVVHPQKPVVWFTSERSVHLLGWSFGPGSLGAASEWSVIPDYCHEDPLFSCPLVFTRWSIHPSVHPSNHPPIHPSIHPSVHPSTRPSSYSETFIVSNMFSHFPIKTCSFQYLPYCCG